jgi:ribosome assembly protein 4
MEQSQKNLAGVAWTNGSLVGSLNPLNHGFRTSDGQGGYIITNTHTQYKRAKRDADGNIIQGDEGDDDVVSNLVVQFHNRDGEAVGDAMDVPTTAGSEELTSLLGALLNPDDADNDEEADAKNKGKIPYAFFAKVTKKIKVRDVSTLELVEKTIKEDIDITDYPSLTHFLRQYRNEVSTEQTLQLTYQPLALFKVRPVTRCTDTLPGHTDAILHVTYSPDGRHLASGGGDSTVRFWDVNTSTPRRTCKGHYDHVLCTSWGRDGILFASGDKRGYLIVWDPVKGEAHGTIKAHSKWITGIDWEPMHRNKSCERLVTSSKDGLAKIWNVRTKRAEATLAGHSDSVECVKWGGEGLIYTASRDRQIKVWNAQDGGGKEGNSRVGVLVKTLVGHGHRVNTLALSCDYVCRTGPFDHYGRVAGVANKDRKSKEWREVAYRAAVEKYAAFKGSEEPERLVSGSDDNTLLVWHPAIDKRPIKRLTGHQQAVNHIAFSPDGRFFASASFDKKIKVWNGRTGDFVNTLTGHVGSVYQVAWSSDGHYLVSASKDSTAKLWEMPSGKKAKETLPGHEDEVYALDWSPSGGSVATGSKDRTLKIWKH